MMERKIAVGVWLCAWLLFLLVSAGMAEQPPKLKIAPVCKQCHIPEEEVLRGVLGNVSQKAETIQIQVGSSTWLVRYDPEKTTLIGAEAFHKIPREKEMAITYIERDGVPQAVKVAVKPPAKVAEDRLIKVDELARLVAADPEKGNFLLIDSRPSPRFLEGHIPGAISIYDAEFDKNVGKLPKDKSKRIVFYCAGVT